jgi:hypothetical protein
MADAYREVVLKLEKFRVGMEATIDSKLISTDPEMNRAQRADYIYCTERQ